MLIQPHCFWIMNKQLNDVEITHDCLRLPLPQAVVITQFSIPLGLNVDIWKNSWNNLTWNAFQNTCFYNMTLGNSALWDDEWVGNCFWHRFCKEEVSLNYWSGKLRKYPKHFMSYWNGREWIEAYENDREWRDHSSSRWHETTTFFIKLLC